MNERPMRVLFVDDEENNLKAFKSSFRREMEVLLANSGEEALRLLETEEVHVIISDQRMRGMTGSAFLAIARERHPKAMRMLLTGFADVDAVIAAVNSGGIFAYCTKPWDENDLKLKIRQAFEIQQLREDKDNLLQRYQGIFDTSGDPIVIVDHAGSVLQANAACGKLLGIPVQEFISQRFTDHIENPGSLVRSLRAHRIGTDFVNVDLTLRTPAGAVIDCLMTATYLGKQEHGREVFQAVIKNITDRRQEEKRLVKLNADLDRRVAVRTGQLLEALEDLGSFSYTVAHDLRSPLKNMVVMSDHMQLLAGAQQVGMEFNELAGRINKGAVHMLDLVNDLLRFSQTNTRELERNSVDLISLLEQAIEDQVADQRKAQLHILVAPGTQVLADAPMLKVLMHNLLSNALKFTRHREDPSITIAHHHANGRDVISVSDNGVGFEAADQEQVFGVFKRLHKGDQFEGTGVGLAIVQRIVTKHGGEVWAESVPNKGTTIHVALPDQNEATQPIPFIKVA